MDAPEQNQKSEETPSQTATVESPSQPLPKTEGPRVANLPITISFLEALLPKDSKILAVRQDDVRNQVIVTVSHPSFKELQNGELPPLKTLLAHREYHVSKMEYQD